MGNSGIFFLSGTPFSYNKALFLYGGFLVTFKCSYLPLTGHHIPKLSPFVLTDVMVRLGTDLQTAFNFNCFLNQEQLKC